MVKRSADWFRNDVIVSAAAPTLSSDQPVAEVRCGRLARAQCPLPRHDPRFLRRLLENDAVIDS